MGASSLNRSTFAYLLATEDPRSPFSPSKANVPSETRNTKRGSLAEHGLDDGERTARRDTTDRSGTKEKNRARA
jgi:hypothetical protein